MYPWLIPVYQQITQSFAQGHGHHALLFKCELGLGTENLLQKLTAFLLCQSENQPCEVCHSCHLLRANNHPDFHLVAPIEGKDIGIDQIRAMNEQSAQHAQQGGNKVFYIQGINRLTEAASNALLKTLEEPRPKTYFLLETDISSPILPTIFSRCQVWTLPTPEQTQSLAWLNEHSGAEISEKQTALLLNYGRPLFALEMLENGWLEKRREFLRQFWRFYQRRSPLELLPHFDQTLLWQQLDWLTTFVSDALKQKLHIQQGLHCQDVAQGILQFSQAISTQHLLRAQQILQQARSDLQKINGVNQEIILLDALAHLITEVFEG